MGMCVCALVVYPKCTESRIRKAEVGPRVAGLVSHLRFGSSEDLKAKYPGNIPTQAAAVQKKKPAPANESPYVRDRGHKGPQGQYSICGIMRPE